LTFSPEYLCFNYIVAFWHYLISGANLPVNFGFNEETCIMAVNRAVTFRGLDEDAAVRAILEGTATETGERFFAALVENLAKALHTYSSWVTEYIPESRQLRALAFWVDGQLTEDFKIDIAGTPCETVIESASLVHYPDNMTMLFPNSSTVKEFSDNRCNFQRFEQL